MDGGRNAGVDWDPYSTPPQSNSIAVVKLYSFLFIYLTTSSGNTIDGEPPSLKILTYPYNPIIPSLPCPGSLKVATYFRGFLRSVNIFAIYKHLYRH